MEVRYPADKVSEFSVFQAAAGKFEGMRVNPLRDTFRDRQMLTRRFDAASGHWLSEGLVIQAECDTRFSLLNRQIARFTTIKCQFVTNRQS